MSDKNLTSGFKGGFRFDPQRQAWCRVDENGNDQEGIGIFQEMSRDNGIYVIKLDDLIFYLEATRARFISKYKIGGGDTQYTRTKEEFIPGRFVEGE